MADPVTDQPSVDKEEPQRPETEGGEEGGGNVVQSTSWWGVSSLSSYLARPHLLEQGINNMASSVAQVCSHLLLRTNNKQFSNNVPQGSTYVAQQSLKV